MGLKMSLARGDSWVKMYLEKKGYKRYPFQNTNYANLAEAASLPPASLVPNCPMGIRRLMLLDPT